MRPNKSILLLRKWFRRSSLGSLIFLLTWTLISLINHRASSPLPPSDSPVKLYANQTKYPLRDLYREAIQSATTSITLAIYSLTDPVIFQALQKKCEEGVSLYIVCDAEASLNLSKTLPQAVIVYRKGKGLMHQKILIIDNEYIWLGSANLTFNSLNVHDNLVTKIEHSSLAGILTEQVMKMEEDGETIPLAHIKTMAQSQHLELWILPDDTHAVRRVIELIRSAKKTIKIAMFTWTRTDFSEELLAASIRGVQVEAIIDYYSARGAGASVVRLLQQSFIPVSSGPKHKLLHHKFAYIDDTILINGSANWTSGAFTKNDDLFVVIYPLTHFQQSFMNGLWKTLQRESTLFTKEIGNENSSYRIRKHGKTNRRGGKKAPHHSRPVFAAAGAH